ncbi:hypothetical protein HK405_000454, partial [Cladochytrium tenue]
MSTLPPASALSPAAAEAATATPDLAPCVTTKTADARATEPPPTRCRRDPRTARANSTLTAVHASSRYQCRRTGPLKTNQTGRRGSATTIPTAAIAPEIRNHGATAIPDAVSRRMRKGLS